MFRSLPARPLSSLAHQLSHLSSALLTLATPNQARGSIGYGTGPGTHTILLRYKHSSRETPSLSPLDFAPNVPSRPADKPPIVADPSSFRTLRSVCFASIWLPFWNIANNSDCHDDVLRKPVRLLAPASDPSDSHALGTSVAPNPRKTPSYPDTRKRLRLHLKTPFLTLTLTSSIHVT